MYGVTTSFGALCIKAIFKEETAQLQRNIILSHSTSVGRPLKQEQAHATMLMILQNPGQGYSGVWLAILEEYHEFLSHGLVPWIPREGSVSCLCPETRMTLVLIGEGRTYFGGRLLPGVEAPEEAGIEPIELCAEEDLTLISGATSATALAVLALYDLLDAAKAADMITAITLEALKELIRTLDGGMIRVHPHPQQSKTAANIRGILADSKVIDHCRNVRIQGALSLRCVPQLHGAARRTLLDVRRTLEIEINSCYDNPIIWGESGEEDVTPACNPDFSYVGVEMSSTYIAAVYLAKMPECRNNRTIDEALSDDPWFLIKNPGFSSGLMIPQYTQMDLLGDMRMLFTPSTINNTSAYGNQGDYVAMGYSAAEKSAQIAKKLEYILAIELSSAYESQIFLDPSSAYNPVTAKILAEIGQHVPTIEQDIFLHPRIEFLRNFVHSGRSAEIAEQVIGRSLL